MVAGWVRLESHHVTGVAQMTMLYSLMGSAEEASDRSERASTTLTGVNGVLDARSTLSERIKFINVKLNVA